jgi:hypothetical protein
LGPLGVVDLRLQGLVVVRSLGATILEEGGQLLLGLIQTRGCFFASNIALSGKSQLGQLEVQIALQ